MQTNLAPEYRDTPRAARLTPFCACAHCGFCTATCPTYQILGENWTAPVAASTS
jgi:L-lactate utilization protein LutB